MLLTVEKKMVYHSGTKVTLHVIGRPRKVALGPLSMGHQ